MGVRGMADRRDVTRAVPGAADVEPLAQSGDLARDAQPADLRNMNPDEVNQPLGNQADPFVRTVETARPSQWEHRSAGEAA